MLTFTCAPLCHSLPTLLGAQLRDASAGIMAQVAPRLPTLCSALAPPGNADPGYF